MDAGLEVTDLTAGYGGLAAVRRVSFGCRHGEVLAMIGPNGAGKTTTLNAVVGLVRPMGGEVRVAGETITGLPPHRVAHHGVAMIPSDRGVFPNLSVAEHLRLALRSSARKAGSGKAWGVDDALHLFPALARRRRAGAGTLSGGEQQMLAITKAMLLGPRVLLIDELSLGLAPKLVQDILLVIRQIVDATGTAVVLVEQHYELGLAIADRCVVLSHGDVAFEGFARDILKQRDKLAAVYLAHESNISFSGAKASG
jgi:branched-chain amino acid transport system ATP-binding protein